MTIEEVAGSQIRRCRETHGWSQTELGRQVGAYLGEPWSRQAVSTAEQGGRRFNLVDLLGLALALRQPVGLLLLPPDGVQVIAVGDGELATSELERIAFPVKDLVSDMQAAVTSITDGVLRVRDLLERIRVGDTSGG